MPKNKTQYNWKILVIAKDKKLWIINLFLKLLTNIEFIFFSILVKSTLINQPPSPWKVFFLASMLFFVNWSRDCFLIGRIKFRLKFRLKIKIKIRIKSRITIRKKNRIKKCTRLDCSLAIPFDSSSLTNNGIAWTETCH